MPATTQLDWSAAELASRLGHVLHRHKHELLPAEQAALEEAVRELQRYGERKWQHVDRILRAIDVASRLGMTVGQFI